MELFACVHGTDRQSIKLSALMFFSALGYVFYSRAGYGYVYDFYASLPQPAHHCRAGGFTFAFTMPRIRGQPRWGVGWYAAESQRKRPQKFTRAIRVARKKCRASATATPSPPRTYVEEDLSIMLLVDFSESQMFVFSDNWDPPTCFGHSPIDLTSGNLPQPSTALSETYAASLVEEETPPCWFLWKSDVCFPGQLGSSNVLRALANFSHFGQPSIAIHCSEWDLRSLLSGGGDTGLHHWGAGAWDAAG